MEEPERRAARGTLRGKHRREHAGVGAERAGPSQGLPIVSCGGDEPQSIRPNARQTLLRPMHAVGADATGKERVRGDEERQAAGAAEGGEPAGDADAVGRAKMAIDDRRAALQTPHDGEGIGRARGIGEEIERWDGRGARLAVEPRRLRR